MRSALVHVKQVRMPHLQRDHRDRTTELKPSVPSPPRHVVAAEKLRTARNPQWQQTVDTACTLIRPALKGGKAAPERCS